MVVKFAIFQSIIIVLFSCGWWIKNRLPYAAKRSKTIINLNLMGIEPLIVFWSVWGLPLEKDLLILPISGALMALLGILAGMIITGFIKLSHKKKAAFLIGSCLSNQGFTMGGFLCYLFFGEAGLAMAVIFMTYFIPLLFLIIFPYARMTGKTDQNNITVYERLKMSIINLQNMPLYAMLLAVALQLTEVQRPPWRLSLDPLLLFSVALYYLTLGGNFQFKNIKGAVRENLALAAIKFIIIPGAVFMVLLVLPIDPTIKQLIMIQSIMPVAVYSVVVSILFDLDATLSSGMFVINTSIFIIFILPLLMIGGETILTILSSHPS